MLGSLTFRFFRNGPLESPQSLAFIQIPSRLSSVSSLSEMCLSSEFRVSLQSSVPRFRAQLVCLYSSIVGLNEFSIFHQISLCLPSELSVSSFRPQCVPLRAQCLLSELSVSPFRAQCLPSEFNASLMRAQCVSIQRSMRFSS